MNVSKGILKKVDAARIAIVDWLDTHELCHGISDEDAACSITAINLALTGELTDEDPSDCMSPVIRHWVIRVQDKMPEKMMSRDDEHGRRWRKALPFVAGSRDPDREQERQDLILNWMWERLGDDWETWVPTEVHAAWHTMLTERTATASNDASSFAASNDTSYAAHVAVTYATHATSAANAAVVYAAHAAVHAAHAAVVYATYATSAATAAAYAATTSAGGAANVYGFWQRADPARLLAALVSS